MYSPASIAVQNAALEATRKRRRADLNKRIARVLLDHSGMCLDNTKERAKVRSALLEALDA